MFNALNNGSPAVEIHLSSPLLTIFQGLDRKTSHPLWRVVEAQSTEGMEAGSRSVEDPLAL